ncbi:MAG: hypothetical protein IJD58_02405 [Lachnospiraceae bacterium]|nr:hypothetical protein [Lachnospiraceae bacterium]
MSREKISEVIDNINDKYVNEAASYEGKENNIRKSAWYKWGAMVACFALLVLGCIKFLPMLISEEDVDNESNEGNVSQVRYQYYVNEEGFAKEWPWEYMTLSEKYRTVNYDGKEYSIKSSYPISQEVIKGKLGTGEATGVDLYTGEKYTESFEVYEINGISSEKLIAAGMVGEYYVYQISEDYMRPATFGELMKLYSLDDNLQFANFTEYEGYKEQGYYTVNDDAYIWQILLECEGATLDDTADSFDRSNREYLSFTATSDALGVYKRVVYISEDGYFATNIFDYSYIYYIGAEAAEKIIEYAEQNSVATIVEPYELTVAGTLVEVGDGYIVIDDSVLCKNKEDGIVYKIDTSDLRIKRCIDNEIVKVGDVVIVKYNGEISEDNYVTGAYSINKGTLVESEPVILE